MKNVFLSCLSAVACATLLAAQPAPTAPPDVQGTWKFVPAQSDFGPNPTPAALTFEMKTKGIVLEVNQTSDDGTNLFTFHTDGTETTNSLPDGSEMKTRYTWQGNVLVGGHKIGEMNLKDKIAFSADGKRMTLDRDIDAPGGGGKMHVVLERIAASPAAAANPSIAGFWKLDAAKSDFSGPSPSKFEAKITIDGHVISMMQSTDQGDAELKLRDDGQETTNEMGGMTMKSKMRWEQNVLVGEHVYSGTGFEMTFKDRTSFSPDGKVMTMERLGQMPDGERKMHIVMVKQ